MAADGHAAWMARALALAERGRATCRPNPMVGCVLVKDGRAIGQGWHERAGGPHAEVAALADAGDAAAGATAYVTLEPCNHHGRTGPCSVALERAGVAQVVYAAADTHRVAHGGAAHLAAAGVDVLGGVLEEWAHEQNLVFFHGVRRARPHVTLKLAQTAEGSLVPPSGRWVTGPDARRAVHAMRALVDAVMVGSGTVLADDPALSVRDVPLRGPAPRAVVIDTRGRVPVDAQVSRPGTIVVTGATTEAPWVDAMRDRGVEVVPVPGPSGQVDLRGAMAELWARDVRAILAEPGATLAAALMDAGLVDRLITHVAGRRLDGVHPPQSVASAATWPVHHVVARGEDLEIERRPPT